jgi:transcriptional regulator with XRE-family HTH domain
MLENALSPSPFDNVLTLSGKQLKAARILAAYKVEELASEAGLVVQTIQRLERDRNPLLSARLDTISRIVTALAARAWSFWCSLLHMRARQRNDSVLAHAVAAAFARQPKAPAGAGARTSGAAAARRDWMADLFRRTAAGCQIRKG